MDGIEDMEAVSYVTQARLLVSSGCYSRAFDLYLSTFDRFPDTKPALEKEFRDLLTLFNEFLLRSKKLGDIFHNFERAIAVFQGNIYILNDIGKYLFKCKFYTEACCHFQKALKIDSGFVSAEKNLNSVKNFLVERWHFRMLNDKKRNDAYRNAIHESITPLRESILDIGTGTGLFILYAKERLPMIITGVDQSSTMMELARNILSENDIEDTILVTEKSTNLDYRGIGGKRSLCMVELFDAGLFGEDVLVTLEHAWENLISPNGTVLPLKAEYFITGVSCKTLNLQHQLRKSSKDFLSIPEWVVHVYSVDPYDANDIEHYDINYITESKSVLKVNFNSLKDIKRVIQRKSLYEIALKVKEAGEVDTIIGWFDLYLTENIKLTTNPTSANKANAWQQSIYFDFIPQTVKKDEIIQVYFENFDKGKMRINHKNKKINIIRISPEILYFLNDEKIIQLISDSIGSVCIYLGQMCQISQMNFVDLSPFPVFGLLMMQRGAKSLICQATTELDRKFIEGVFEANNIPLFKVKILLDEELTKEAFQDLKFHAIYHNMLDPCGDLNTRFRDLAIHLKKVHLHLGGLFLPFKITLEAQIVSSVWLDINNRVNDANVHGFKMAMYMNKYQVSQNIDIDLAHLQYNALSEQITLVDVSDEMASDVYDVPGIKNGDANGVLCWYTVQIVENGETINTNRNDSFINSMAFLANPSVNFKEGDIANILLCVDTDGAFKLVIDKET